MMKLLTVNVGMPRDVAGDDGIVTTGIFKEPVPGRVMVRTLNIDGDAQADLQNHGGIYQAVYAYPGEHYDTWQRELGRTDFTPGQFGENLTVTGMTEENVHIGDVFRVGGALLQVTQPRTPCYKLALKMGMPEFPKRFLASGRTGYYLRVLEEGEVGAGDAIERVQTDPARVTVRALARLLHFEPGNLEGTRDALRAEGLSPGWRRALERRLGKEKSR